MQTRLDPVSWVRYLWPCSHDRASSRVAQWGSDQFGDSIAYAHVAVE